MSEELGREGLSQGWRWLEGAGGGQRGASRGARKPSLLSLPAPPCPGSPHLAPPDPPSPLQPPQIILPASGLLDPPRAGQAHGFYPSRAWPPHKELPNLDASAASRAHRKETCWPKSAQTSRWAEDPYDTGGDLKGLKTFPGLHVSSLSIHSIHANYANGASLVAQ